MHVCFCCVCFNFSVLSQEISWVERLRNDPHVFCVELDVKQQLSRPKRSTLKPDPHGKDIIQRESLGTDML